MRFRVQISRREGIADPEGTTTAHALRELGYNAVSGVAFGREITLDLAVDDEDEGSKLVTEMCERLLANPVIEDYTVERIG